MGGVYTILRGKFDLEIFKLIMYAHVYAQESTLTYYSCRGRSFIFPKLVLSTATVLCTVFYFRITNDQTIVICDGKLVSFNNSHTIFLPSDRWCWYSTNWTSDRDGSL